MLLGAPAAATGYIPTNLYEYVDYHALYIHDDFRITPKLTLNLGLRWERETGLREVNNNLITDFDAAAANPIGQAAGVDTKGVFLFAGQNGEEGDDRRPESEQVFSARRFCVSADSEARCSRRIRNLLGSDVLCWLAFEHGRHHGNDAALSVERWQQDAGSSLSNPFPNGLDRPVGNSLGAMTGIGKAVTIFDPNAKSTRVQQFSADVQYQVNNTLVATVGYSGSRTSDLTWTTASYNYNQLDPSYWSQGASLNQAVPNPFYGVGGVGTIGGSTVARNQLLRPYPQFGAVNFNFSSRNMAQYDSMVDQGCRSDIPTVSRS